MYIFFRSVLKCFFRPELYGKDLVPHLSKILNDCNNPDGAVACALAIDGISVLCKHEVIDAVTTWATLAPLLQNDKRLPVIKRYIDWFTSSFVIWPYNFGTSSTSLIYV